MPNIDKELTYDLSKKKKGVLGSLEGICADTIKSTRNGRSYSEKLWENVFKDPIVQEHFNNGGIFGELGHPVDREETDMEKIAICMPKPPKKDKNGKLYGHWDILDTPNGRILKCLCDYGYKIGISSRGSGDIVENYDGTENVDPETYHFEAFDAVLLPAVKEARLNLVESVNKNLNKALTETINKSKDSEKKLMIETLNNLHINYTDNSISDNNKEVDSKNDEVDNIESTVLQDLQEALKRNRELEQELNDLHSKNSVSYAKEVENSKLLEQYKQTIIILSDKAKSAKVLKEQLSKMSSDLGIKDNEIKRLNNKLNESKKRASINIKQLNEELETSTNNSENFQNQLSLLNESYDELLKEHKDSEAKHEQIIEDLKKNSNIREHRLQEQLNKSEALNSKYQSIAREAVNRYINSQAKILGINSESIKRKLPENYSFKDIDRICEDLRDYNLTVSSLPFNTSSIRSKNIEITESKQSIPVDINNDDIVDDQLLSLAGIK